MAKILLVDDSEIDRGIYKEILLSSGHEVTELNDGKKVVDTISQDDYDLLLIDILMENDAFSVMNGLTERNIRIPTITMSSSSFYLDILKSFDVNELLIKPFMPETLIDCINRTLK